MADPEDKGFKVVDKRGRTDEEREKEKPSAPPPPEPPKEDGNRAEPGGVHGKKSPDREPSPMGGPAFLDLVGMLQLGAMAHLGMIQEPGGKRTPVNLPSAKDSIDILAVLQEKTKGNLTTEEDEVLREGLYHLRMAYLAATKSGQRPGGKDK